MKNSRVFLSGDTFYIFESARFRNGDKNISQCRLLKILPRVLSVKAVPMTIHSMLWFKNYLQNTPYKPFTTANSADDKLMIFSFFSQKTGNDFSCINAKA